MYDSHLFHRLEFTCHGSWRENQTSFIIARHAGTKHGVCISFKQSTTDTAQLYIGDSCYRDHQELDSSSERQYTIANLTNVGRKFYPSGTPLMKCLINVFQFGNIGKCGDHHSSSIKTTANWLLTCLLLPWSLMAFTSR